MPLVTARDVPKAWHRGNRSDPWRIAGRDEICRGPRAGTADGERRVRREIGDGTELDVTVSIGDSAAEPIAAGLTDERDPFECPYVEAVTVLGAADARSRPRVPDRAIRVPVDGQDPEAGPRLCCPSAASGVEAPVMVILSLPCFVAGVALANVASKRPVRQAVIETVAGCLIVLGLCLVGAGLPMSL